MVWLLQRSLQQVSWVFRHLPCCGECLSGKNQRDNTTPFKIQLPENRTQPHFNTNCAIQISRFHVQVKSSHICNNLTEDSVSASLALLCSSAWLQGRAGTHQEPRNHCFWKTVSLSPHPCPDKKTNVLNSSCFIWGLSSSEHICIFTVWGFYLTILSDF